MSWSTLVVIAVLFSVAYLLHIRGSLQKYADDFRNVVKELDSRTQRLDKAREAALESSKEIHRRTAELDSLRDRAASLLLDVESLKAERAALTERLADRDAKVADLAGRLATSEVRRAQLEKDLSAASVVRWELLSKLHVDERQRVTALNRLRRPQQDFSPIAVSLEDGNMHAWGVGSPSQQSTSRAIVLPPSPPQSAMRPMPPVTKSPSESYLLSLRPDLTVSDSEEEDDLGDNDAYMRSSDLNMLSTQTPPRPAVPPPISLHRDRSEGLPEMRDEVCSPADSALVGHASAESAPLALHRAPWVDALNPALQVSKHASSMASALEPELEESSSGIFTFNRSRRGSDAN